MTREQIKECCYDLGSIPYEIPDSYGEGIVGKEYYSGKAERPRKVMLEITSFRGIAWDAQHFYGTLKVYHAPILKEGSKFSHFGYLGEDTPLFKDGDITIELWRYVTEKERREGPRRYEENMKVTNGWLKKAPLLNFAKEVFKERFTGDWELTIEDYTR